MPELPEVETVVRGLRPVLDGAEIARVEARRADLRWPLPVDLVQRLTGARVTGLSRRAKFGLVETSRGDTLIFHLGMSGRMRLDPAAIERHDHVLLQTGAGRVVAFNDARRFGALDIVATDVLADHRWLAGLGPEPLSEALDADRLRTALAGRRAPVKALLLDQRIVAGLGNIYVCEALHRAGIRPQRMGGRVSAREARALVAAIKAVLTEAIAAGGSSLRDHVQPDGTLGYFQHGFAVYGRAGQGCARCGQSILRLVQGGRSSFWCRRCQR